MYAPAVPYVEVFSIFPPITMSSESNRKAKSKQKNAIPIVSPADIGWVPIKRRNARVVDTTDKLVLGRWSVAVKSCVSELIISEPCICLAFVLEAKKIMSELKGSYL